jgi:hypothetical protein
VQWCLTWQVKRILGVGNCLTLTVLLLFLILVHTLHKLYIDVRMTFIHLFLNFDQIQISKNPYKIGFKTWSFFFFCFVTGVTSQKCRRAPHSKLCQSPSHFRPRAGSSARNPVSGILQSLLYAYYPRNFPIGASLAGLQLICNPTVRLCNQRLWANLQKSDDANRTRHIAETHLPRTSLSEADASPPNVIDGAAGSFLAYKVR